MPRDANGNYLPVAGYPVVTDTLITSTYSNIQYADVGAELQDSLSRSGKGGFTAPVGIVDKSGAVPGLNFLAEPTSGFKREGTEDLRMQVTATDVWQAVKTGVKVLTPGSGGTLKHPVVEESGQTVMRGVSGVTTVFFYQDTPDTGWTLVEPDANIRELIIGPSGAGQGGQIGGTIDPTTLDTAVATTVTVSITTVAGTSDGHALTIAEMPSHTHFGGTNANGNQSPGGSAAGNILQTSPTGGNAAHSHGIPSLSGSGTGTGTGSITTITPRYARGILAVLA